MTVVCTLETQIYLPLNSFRFSSIYRTVSSIFVTAIFTPRILHVLIVFIFLSSFLLILEFLFTKPALDRPDHNRECFLLVLPFADHLDLIAGFDAGAKDT